MSTSERRKPRDESRIEARLDVERLMPLIARHLPDCRDRLELSGGRVIAIQLKPGIECLGHYELTFQLHRTGERVSQAVLVHLTDIAPRPVIDPGAIGIYHALDLPIRTVETEIPELSAVLLPSALDPGLPHLIEALDRDAMKRRLKPLLPLGDERLASIRPRLISHTPGARATIRYRLWSGEVADAPRRESAVIGKLNAHRELATVMADYHALWQCTAERFQQARPLGTIQDLGLSIQTMVEGERLNAFVDSPKLPRLLEAVGEALATFHRAPLPLERVRDPQREITSFTNRSHLLRAVMPDPGRLARLVDRLTEAVAAHCRVTGPVHGDFHHANIMANDAGVALIDFDEMGLGDPALDVGRFVGSLSVPSLRSFGDLRLLDLGREHFLRAYLDQARIDSRRVRLFEAAAYIISALTLWRLARTGWETRIPGLIGLAEEALDEALRRPPPPRHGAGPRVPRSRGSRRWASDPAYIGQLMKPAVHALHGAEVHRTELAVRTERGRNLSLACAMSGATASGRWRGEAEGICRPGLGTRTTARLMDHLRAVLGDGADAFALPTVLGMNQRLGLLLWEKPRTRNLPLKGAEGAPGGAAHLARALARLHASGDGFGPDLTVADYLARRNRPPAREFGIDPAERLVPSLAWPRVPHFGLADGRIVIRRPDKLGLAPALLAVAEIEHDIAARAGRRQATRFRAEYLARAGRGATALDAFAALAAQPRATRGALS